MRSAWYRPPSLHYIRKQHEVKRMEYQYVDYLMRARQWTEKQALAYLKQMRETDERCKQR